MDRIFGEVSKFSEEETLEYVLFKGNKCIRMHVNLDETFFILNRKYKNLGYIGKLDGGIGSDIYAETQIKFLFKYRT